jgi:hypothetical protein
MSTVVLTSADTTTINQRIFNDLADGDAVTLTFANNIAELKTGKNGNSIYAQNETGKQCQVKIRVLRGSSDDKFLNRQLVLQEANFSGFVLLIGEFIKKLGDGKGNVASDIYSLSGGIFQKRVEAKTNVEGDTSQAVAEYSLIFSQAPRALT